MKHFIKYLQCASMALAALAAMPIFAATNVGVSVGISQPGAYGRIDIGNFPRPEVVYPQPVIIAPTPVAVYQQPIYLYVPPDHQQHWSRYCGRYAACGQPVYFVQERWVREHHPPRGAYREGYREGYRDGDRDDHPGKGWKKDKHGGGHDRGRGHRD